MGSLRASRRPEQYPTYSLPILHLPTAILPTERLSISYLLVEKDAMGSLRASRRPEQ